MKQTDKPFGEALAELMAERGMSSRALARAAGFNPGGGSISHYTKQYIHPEYESMERIALALEVPPTYFAEYRLETIRMQLDWHAMRGDHGEALRWALKRGRALSLDV